MMRSGPCSAVLLASSAALAASLALSACSHNYHPDHRTAIYNSFEQHDLRSITVSQDRRAGVITLRGVVGASDRRQRAEQLAGQAAPGYTIVDQIQVNDAGLESDENAARHASQLDSAIEDRYKATLASHRALKSRNIQYSAFNGTLTLKGSVRTPQERKEAEDLARKLPRVHHVVNEIQIQSHGKPSPANS